MIKVGKKLVIAPYLPMIGRANTNTQLTTILKSR